LSAVMEKFLSGQKYLCPPGSIPRRNTRRYLTLCVRLLYNGCMKKVRINFALTEEARDTLRDIAAAQGVSMTAMLEIIIRQVGKKDKSNAL